MPTKKPDFGPHDVTLKHAGPMSEISPEFLQGMLNRMAVSFHKYGYLKDNIKPPRGKIDAIKCLEQRLEQFKKTGNTEFLMDVANFAMMRYIYPLKGEFFAPTDTHESPGLTLKDGTKVHVGKDS